MILIGNGALITHNDRLPFMDNGCVAVDGAVITDYGGTGEMRQKYAEARFEDAGGKVIMPGLINTHMHIYSAFARGMILKNAPVSRNFSEILENLWWRLDKAINLEDVRYSAYTTYIDCIKNGVTTVFDHHASQRYVEGSLFTIAKAAKQLGIRASLCYEVSDRDGGEICRQAIRENIDFIKYADDMRDNDMVKGMFGLHASFTLSDKTLADCVAAMGGMNAGFHIHAAEGIADVHDSLKRYGKRVVNRLFDAGILGEKTIAAHCVHINPAEVELLAETNTIAVHNPESNMGNAVGCAAIMPLMARGVTLGLGTDGYTADMFESMKAANILHKHQLCDPSAAWGEVPQMLFRNNRNIAGRFFDEIGVIEAGAKADVIIVDYDAPTPIGPDNAYSHILFGMTGRSVDSTMINGEFVYKNRRLLTACEKEVYIKSRETAASFWKRVNSCK